MSINRTLLILLLSCLFSLSVVKTDAEVSSWSLEPSVILKNILKGVETDGPRKDTVAQLRRLIQDYPNSSVTDEAILRLADIYLKDNRIAEAKTLYQDILERFPLSDFKAEALYGFAYCQFRSGDLRDARANLQGLLSFYRTSILFKAKAELLLADINTILTKSEEGIEGNAIGVILPLKGQYARFGHDALKGVLLAAGAFGDEEPYEIILKDSGGDPLLAKKAVDELAKDERIIGIIGPLLSKTAMDAAMQAQRIKIPIISLSQAEGLPEIGRYVFRNSLTLAEQAEAIADYAINSLGCKTFVILHPDNLYGRELAAKFEKAVLEGGGEVLARSSYVEGQTDFGKEIKDLFKIEEETSLEGRRTIVEYTPTIIPDAIYIPDYAEAVGLIAPQLTYYNVKEIKMLGSNGWNSPRLVAVGGKYVEGAVFVDGFFPGSKRKYTKRFVIGFRDAYKKSPGIIEAQAYDVTKMFIRMLKEGTTDRREIMEELKVIYGFEGATGTISFDESGEAVKDLYILSVQGRSIVETESD